MYATISQLKDHLNIGNTDQDTKLTVALNAAQSQIDRYCRRTFHVPDVDADDATARIYDAASPLWIDDLVKVDAVETRSHLAGTWTAVDIANVQLRPVNAAADGDPFTHIRSTVTLSGEVRVTGWFGWPELPSEVVEATIVQASRLHTRQGATLGVHTAVATEGVVGMRLLAKLDPDVEILLQPLRRRPVLI